MNTKQCNDCDVPLSTKRNVCEKCLLLRSKCKNAKCESKVPEQYEYCHKCSCKSKDCNNPRVKDQEYCNSCRVLCFKCNENYSIYPHKICFDCYSVITTCSNCNIKKCKFNKMNNTYFTYCFDCKCSTFNCDSLVAENGIYCKDCADCLCVQCNITFAMTNSELCKQCEIEARPKCNANECKNKVPKIKNTNEFYKYCHQCGCIGKCNSLKLPNSDFCLDCVKCKAENCFYATETWKKTQYCSKCNYEYKKWRGIKCPITDCNQYCSEKYGTCKEH